MTDLLLFPRSGSKRKTPAPLGSRQPYPTVCSFKPPSEAADRKGRRHGNGPRREAEWGKHRQSHGPLCPQSRPVGKYYTRHIPETQSKQSVIPGPCWQSSTRKCWTWKPCGLLPRLRTISQCSRAADGARRRVLYR